MMAGAAGGGVLAAAGFFRVPLPMVVLGLAPFGILASWYGARGK